ncbi:MAG: TauD/TfdA family dioxygenase [Burkholderiaceae bacterium]|nr:TauD/TfdA family dioxygenase [Burkholderiaceae bacterium]
MKTIPYRHIGVRPIAGALGAEISGVNLAQPLSNEVFAEVRRAFFENLVVMFRDQVLTEDQQCDFAERFGPLTKSAGLKADSRVFMVTKAAQDKGRNVGGHWHADGTQAERVPMASVLYAMEVPPYGGDTMFCNLYAAYDMLSPGMKKLAESLVVVHAGTMGYGGKGHVAQDFIDKNKHIYDFEAGRIDNEHPLVVVIPETGRKVLYAPSPMAFYFRDMSVEDSAPLINYFQAIAEKAENTCRFSWTKGSVLMWDNRATYHFAINDYHGMARTMRRVQIEGNRPFGPAMPVPSPVPQSQLIAVRAAGF